MAIRREQSGRGGTLQFNNTLQGDYQPLDERTNNDARHTLVVDGPCAAMPNAMMALPAPAVSQALAKTLGLPGF